MYLSDVDLRQAIEDGELIVDPIPKEDVGTPEENPRFICFVDGKSTRARTGLVIHLTAPTIHAGWHGNITLEMTNCGPLDLVLHTGDAVAQLTVAQITKPPERDIKLSTTHGQTDVHGGKSEII